MKILFIYPDIITKNINFCPAIHVLSAVLKAEGHNVNLLHINENAIEYDRKVIVKLSKGYDLYAFTSTSFNYKYANEIAGWLQDEYPETLIVLGGYHATTQPDDFESSNFDIFCIGEGEGPMKELCHALETGAAWANIANLITRTSKNPVRGFLRDMNTLPFWDFDITDTKKIVELRKGWLSISFSRGCPYECTFCYNHLLKAIEIGPDDKMSDYIRRRTPGSAVMELESLAKKYPVKFFNIDDDLLTMNKKWMREFTDLYRQYVYEPMGIRYVVNARADTLSDDICRMLGESGCKEARLGFETGNEKLRNELLQKKTSNEALIRACESLSRYGVQSVAFAMMGVPGESWSTFVDTVNMTIKLKPSLIRMTFLYPYKHTKIYDVCVERGLLKENYSGDNRDLDSPLKFEGISDEEMFQMRFLFPWYVNYAWHGIKGYSDAIRLLHGYNKQQLEDMIPAIMETDRKLSSECKLPHYRYYPGNEYYFELYDNKQNTI